MVVNSKYFQFQFKYRLIKQVVTSDVRACPISKNHVHSVTGWLRQWTVYDTVFL
jgi:hypothetical protein